MIKIDQIARDIAVKLVRLKKVTQNTLKKQSLHQAATKLNIS